MHKIKVFVVDDHPVFREEIRLFLEKSGSFSVVGEAADGQTCINEIPADTEVVLMDISMPVMNGVEATQKLVGQMPDVKVIALTMFGDEIYYYKMIHAGVSGFVLKEEGSRDIQQAIQQVFSGRNYFSRSLLHRIAQSINRGLTSEEQHAAQPLTETELKILSAIRQGLALDAMATSLGLAENDFDQALMALYTKTQTENRAELILYTISNNLTL